jgi:PAT family acetyl-CoA transporter-like MFS transporter 1
VLTLSNHGHVDESMPHAVQVPIQLASAALMLVSADWAEGRLKEADIVSITALFFVLVLLAATQDIAVDGWALTLLSRQHIG